MGDGHEKVFPCSIGHEGVFRAPGAVGGWGYFFIYFKYWGVIFFLGRDFYGFPYIVGMKEFLSYSSGSAHRYFINHHSLVSFI